MEQDRDEFVVLHVLASRARRPLPIYSGDPPQPIDPDWLAITESSSRGCEPDSWILYFLRNSGEILEILKWETVEIALDQAASIAGVPRSAWSRCRVAVPASGEIPRSLVPVPIRPAV